MDYSFDYEPVFGVVFSSSEIDTNSKFVHISFSVSDDNGLLVSEYYYFYGLNDGDGVKHWGHAYPVQESASFGLTAVLTVSLKLGDIVNGVNTVN